MGYVHKLSDISMAGLVLGLSNLREGMQLIISASLVVARAFEKFATHDTGQTTDNSYSVKSMEIPKWLPERFDNISA